LPISPQSITSAIKTVTTEITLNDGSNARGGGSLMLVVRRLSDGSTSAQWFARSIRNGRRTKLAIGRYPETTLAMARQQMAAELSPMIKSGKQLRVNAPAEAPTVERMFQGYVASMRTKNRASADEVERQLLLAKDNAADALGRHRLASEIEDADVVAYVASFYKRGYRGAADKCRSYIASAYAWAKKSTNDYTDPHRRDWGVKNNPAADVPRDAKATSTRDRALDATELAALWQAAIPGNGFTTETAACIRLLIATGQRVQEVLRLEASELDLAAALWKMPAHKTKGRNRKHAIPLPPQVLPVLAQLKQLHPTGPLFPARNGSDGELIGHRSIGQALGRWLAGDDCQVAPFQTRDIRRTWKSRAHDAGIDRFTRDLIQQHAKHDTGSKNYDRAEYLPQMREAMAKWGQWLLENGCE
jgi:integrase